jgi:hypothetical protein
VFAAYPPEEGKVPNGWVLFPRDEWHKAIIASQFVSDPVNAGLLPVEADYLPTAADDVVSRYQPGGFPNGPVLHTLFLGEPGDDVVLAFQDRQLRMTKLAESDPAQLASEMVAYRGGWSEKFTDDILIVSSEERDRPYALVAGAWSGFTGDTVAFTGRESVPQATIDLLEQRQQLRLIKPTIWLIGPPSVLSEKVAGELSAYGEVKRIAGSTPVEMAVEMARYRDDVTGFGWGHSHAPANFSLVNINDWANAVAAFQLAGSGPRAALLLTDNTETLPPAVSKYLGQIKDSEASQGYVLGDRTSISASQLAELDHLLAGD